MKKTTGVLLVRVLGIIALVAIIGFSMAACSSDPDPDLPGTITVSPSTGVTTGMELTATYSGTETVSYQWKKGDANVGTSSNKFTPTEAGSYTVTVSATGFNSKTSAAVTVTVPANLSGTITISPNTNVTTGMELTATYSGTETVSYQWKNGATNVGTNSNKYTPTAAGSYTVTVSATGFNSKTSAAVTVTVPTGPQWTAVANSTFGTSNISAIAYGNGKFVAGGYDGKMATSTDGKTWTAVVVSSIFGTSEIRSIAYGGDKFVAGGTDGKVAVSTDGVTWTAGDIASTDMGTISSFTISYCKDMFAARGSSSEYVTSTDGITWVDKGSGTIPIQTIAYGNDIFVAGAEGLFANSTLSKGKKIAISPDGGAWGVGTTWELKDVSGSFPGIPADDIAFKKIIFENGKFIALFGKTLSPSAGKITTSTDGVTWTTPVSSTMINPLSIVYGNNKFVASGYDMQGSAFTVNIATSTDGGATWTSTNVTNIFSGSPLVYVAYGSGKFVVVGMGGKIAYLEDN